MTSLNIKGTGSTTRKSFLQFALLGLSCAFYSTPALAMDDEIGGKLPPSLPPRPRHFAPFQPLQKLAAPVSDHSAASVAEGSDAPMVPQQQILLRQHPTAQSRHNALASCKRDLRNRINGIALCSRHLKKTYLLRVASAGSLRELERVEKDFEFALVEIAPGLEMAAALNFEDGYQDVTAYAKRQVAALGSYLSILDTTPAEINLRIRLFAEFAGIIRDMRARNHRTPYTLKKNFTDANRAEANKFLADQINDMVESRGSEMGLGEGERELFSENLYNVLARAESPADFLALGHRLLLYQLVSANNYSTIKIKRLEIRTSIKLIIMASYTYLLHICCEQPTPTITNWPHLDIENIHEDNMALFCHAAVDFAFAFLPSTKVAYPADELSSLFAGLSIERPSFPQEEVDEEDLR